MRLHKIKPPGLIISDLVHWCFSQADSCLVMLVSEFVLIKVHILLAEKTGNQV